MQTRCLKRNKKGVLYHQICCKATDVQIIIQVIPISVSGSSTTKMSNPTEDVKLSHEQMTFIERHLSVNTSSIVEARDPSLYSILLFNPLQEHGAILTCPRHGHNLQDTGIWTHMRSMGKRRPRHLYHLGENVLLISSVYACSACGDDFDKDTYMAHHPDLVRQLSGRHSPPFHLFQSSGVTRQAYDMIVTSALSGTSFAEIETSLQRHHGFHIATFGRSEDINVSRKHQSPSWMLCQRIFMYDYELRRPHYESQMKKIIPSEFSIDHTFNTSQMVRVTKKKVFSALLLVADEGGRVCTFTLTTSKSLENVESHLKELKNRGGKTQTIHTGMQSLSMPNIVPC